MQLCYQLKEAQPSLTVTRLMTKISKHNRACSSTKKYSRKVNNFTNNNTVVSDISHNN
jgi:hypothetical protein